MPVDRSCPSLLLVLASVGVLAAAAPAAVIDADPATYRGLLPALQPGDTLRLAAGRYLSNLPLVDLLGTASQPIVITGGADPAAVVFEAQSCCNTVSITRCAYVTVRRLTLRGMGHPVDAVKGEGTTGNWAHHITLEELDISGYDPDQQIVGISTKCHAWNWTIRRNRIVGCGTGMYLGNSDGDKPFVNGLIEHNLVLDATGYCLQIKHQNTGVRDAFPGTAAEGRTVIRANVFSKERGASTGANARPAVLLGAFPASGAGAADLYDVYGNFFYQNPVEALLQVTGSTALHANIFVNHSDGAGFPAISFTSQNGFRPRRMDVFQNTVWAANSAGGIRLVNADPAFVQRCAGNAVFSGRPVSGFSDTAANATGTYADAAQVFVSATTDLATLDLYPRAGMLRGPALDPAPFTSASEYDRDFNRLPLEWSRRGAYGGDGANPGWKLARDIMPARVLSVRTPGRPIAPPPELDVFPQPAVTHVLCRISARPQPARLIVVDAAGRVLERRLLPAGAADVQRVETSGWTRGVYTLVYETGSGPSAIRRILLR